MTATLAVDVAAFIAHKRALGRTYRTEERTLRLLVAFAAEHDVHHIGQLTSALLDAFVGSRPRTRSRSFNHLVGIVGCFLTWAVAQQKLTVSPLRVTRRRHADLRVPYVFNIDQARSILNAAAALPDNPGATDRGATYRTIFALCYGLGLRAGEACGITAADVDVDRQLIVVRGGKFGKDRLVPHGPRIGELLARQIERRGPGGDGPLFSFDGQRHIHPGTASHVFHQLLDDIGIVVPAGVSTPTLHSLRHSFAVGCLLRWYRQGINPATRLYELSTFMGHVSPLSTAVYLTITPELFSEANHRFETLAMPAWATADQP